MQLYQTYTRAYLKEDYNSLQDWWTKWGWEAPYKELLPETGLILIEENRMVAAGFIYITNSPLAWLEWVISDPTLKVKNINKLISDLITIANEKEASIIITSFDNFQKGSDKLKKIYEDCGFKSIGSNMTLMTRGNINKSFLSEEFFKI